MVLIFNFFIFVSASEMQCYAVLKHCADILSQVLSYVNRTQSTGWYETVMCDVGSQPFRSRANSLAGANRPVGPWPIRSRPFRSLAVSLPGTFVPRSEMARELSFQGSQTASGKMRICGPADFQTCKMRMVLLIFFADVTGKMRMRTQYYKLKKNIAFR